MIVYVVYYNDDPGGVLGVFISHKNAWSFAYKLAGTVVEAWPVSDYEETKT